MGCVVVNLQFNSNSPVKWVMWYVQFSSIQFNTVARTHQQRVPVHATRVDNPLVHSSTYVRTYHGTHNCNTSSTRVAVRTWTRVGLVLECIHVCVTTRTYVYILENPHTRVRTCVWYSSRYQYVPSTYARTTHVLATAQDTCSTTCVRTYVLPCRTIPLHIHGGHRHRHRRIHK